MTYKKVVSIILASAGLTSCQAGKYYDDTYSTDKQMTLGLVQKELKKGMGQDEVATSLGSPNIVTQDKEGKETWIYDKIATQVRSSSSGGFILFCQRGVDHVSRKDMSQQTLTVVIKFDAGKRVDSISYHSSKF
jgi:outer membrane protein assembly factor BamE (lipoprotein component of BamABCDE complex)